MALITHMAMDILLSPGSRQLSCNHELCTGWYPTAKLLTSVQRPHRVQRLLTWCCTSRVTMSEMRKQIWARITERPRLLVRSLNQAKKKTTTRASEAPTAANALAGVRSKPRSLERVGKQKHDTTLLREREMTGVGWKPNGEARRAYMMMVGV